MKLSFEGETIHEDSSFAKMAGFEYHHIEETYYDNVKIGKNYAQMRGLSFVIRNVFAVVVWNPFLNLLRLP